MPSRERFADLVLYLKIILSDQHFWKFSVLFELIIRERKPQFQTCLKSLRDSSVLYIHTLFAQKVLFGIQ